MKGGFPGIQTMQEWHMGSLTKLMPALLDFFSFLFYPFDPGASVRPCLAWRSSSCWIRLRRTKLRRFRGIGWRTRRQAAASGRRNRILPPSFRISTVPFITVPPIHGSAMRKDSPRKTGFTSCIGTLIA